MGGGNLRLKVVSCKAADLYRIAAVARTSSSLLKHLASTVPGPTVFSSDCRIRGGGQRCLAAGCLVPTEAFLGKTRVARVRYRWPMVWPIAFRRGMGSLQ